MTLILAVDDETLYQHLLQVNLEKEGYDVITASDGEEALDLVSNRHPDLVVLDIMMPKLDGIRATERIRQFSNVPIIILTAKGDEHDRV
ncbi:MAG: response regulator, partial [Anaerolineaceae bacterium]